MWFTGFRVFQVSPQQKENIICGFKVFCFFICILNRGSLKHFSKLSENAEEECVGE